MEKKTIFISDIHMNDARSLDEGKYRPYGWLNANKAIELASFLRKVADPAKIDEIVMLGDVIDTWVCPIDVKPQDTESILKSWQNKPIIDSLVDAIGKNIKVTYVIGNHDMLIDVEVLKKNIPGIIFIGYGEGMSPGIYRSGNLLGEHGNIFTMFNAPDRENSIFQNLPLGYFVSRIAASKIVDTGLNDIFESIVHDHEELEEMVKKTYRKANVSKAKDFLRKRETLPEIVIDTICALRGIKKEDMNKPMIVMPDNKKVSVQFVKEKYADLYRQWANKYGDDYAFQAFYAESGHLSFAANRLLDKMEVNIVLFGHTHIKKGKRGERENTIYANTGTWCDNPKKPFTYVESQKDLENKVHRIRLMKWNNGKMTQLKKEEIPLR